jgi:cytochrome c-type biogenesis protein CcmE
MSKKTTRAVLSLTVVGGALSLLMYTSLTEGAVQYFKHVDEVMATPADWYGKPLQLHGFVVDGSILQRPKTLDYRFKVKHGNQEVTANYTGIVPDTFQDGAEVVLRGRLTPEGFFEVEKGGVMAKCPSKYEADGGPPAYPR